MPATAIAATVAAAVATLGLTTASTTTAVVGRVLLPPINVVAKVQPEEGVQRGRKAREGHHQHQLVELFWRQVSLRLSPYVER